MKPSAPAWVVVTLMATNEAPIGTPQPPESPPCGAKPNVPTAQNLRGMLLTRSRASDVDVNAAQGHLRGPGRRWLRRPVLNANSPIQISGMGKKMPWLTTMIHSSNIASNANTAMCREP